MAPPAPVRHEAAVLAWRLATVAATVTAAGLLVSGSTAPATLMATGLVAAAALALTAAEVRHAVSRRISTPDADAA